MRSRRIRKPVNTSITNNFEKKQLFTYLQTFLSKKAHIKEFIERIGEWYDDYGSNLIKCSLMDNEELEKYDDFRTFARKKHYDAVKRADILYQKVCSRIARISSVHISQLEQKIELVTELLKLSDIEKEILGYYVRLKFNADVENLKNTLFGHCDDRRTHCSFFLKYTQNQIDTYLNPSDKLISCGLLEMEYNGDIILGQKGAQLFSQYFKNITDLKKVILGSELTSTLNWKDFKHIPDRDFCAKLLKNSVRSNCKGINILLYGEPGTGKTEFAKTMCHKASVELYAIGEKYDDRRRIESLNMAQNTIHKTDKVCFLIDEADDLMDEKKIHLNRILENNATPCIWIVNSIRYWDKAYLRRFTYAMDFKKPNIEVRTEIVKRSLKQYNIKIDNKKAEELAKEYNLTPSFIVTAAKSAKIIKGGIKEVCQNLDAMEKAYNNGMDKPKRIEKKKDDKKSLDFNVALLNTDTDLGKLAEQIKTLKKNKFSLCLYGVSGTGKSAYAEYLAEQLKMSVVKKRCSDLLSKWFGETEQNIARAFSEAKDKRALLIFDEADSFLYNREGSSHGWEVTQVNEMLTQMEKHELPFVCTTNLMDNLDKACLRRFTFKVEYKYMTPEQNSLAFDHFFKMKDVDLSHISTLAPGDFVVVKEKAEIMGYLDNKDELIKMLEMEQRQKTPITNSHHIGFL